MPTPTSDVDKLAKILEEKEENRKKEKEKEQPKIDIGSSIKAACLVNVTPDLWPRASTVEFIAAEMTKLKKKQVTRQYDTNNTDGRRNDGLNDRATDCARCEMTGATAFSLRRNTEMHARMGGRRI